MRSRNEAASLRLVLGQSIPLRSCQAVSRLGTRTDETVSVRHGVALLHGISTAAQARGGQRELRVSAAIAILKN